MKIMFILSATPELSVKDAHFYHRRYPIMAPSLTLLILSELARLENHTVELLDTRLHMSLPSDPNTQEWENNLDVVEDTISKSDADVVGISFLSSSALEAYKIAKLCRKHGKTVIAGGLHATVAEADLIEQKVFHYIYQGEAETGFLSLIEKLQSGQLARYPEMPQIIRASPLPLNLMNKIPAVSDFSIYAEAMAQHPQFRSVYIELSRGCVKNCTFCEIAKSGAAFKPFRPIPLETVYKTVETAVKRYKANYVLVSDSIATLHKRNFLEFMSYIHMNYPEVTVQFNSTVDRLDEEIAEAIRDVKCNVWFGFESGSQRILDMIEKGTTVEQAHQAAKICRKYNIASGFNVLLGVPNETRDDYEQTMDFFERHRQSHPNPNILNPLPGTAMYRYCHENNLLRYKKDYSIWNAGRIENAGYAGPIVGVDYRMMLEYQARLFQLQNEPARQLGK